jgi:tetratricopeptide (TPR) repeat protein
VQSSAGDPERGVALLTRAREAFPASHATSLALARGQRAIGDYAAALASVEVVLADLPTHRDALLARVENLSALQRHDEAVTVASRMIELGTWHVGDAYYWRAWNTFYLRDLDGAWADVERASTLQSNASVLTLAGFIAHARKDLETAIDRFDRAFVMDQKNCIAAFSGAMVEVERQRWADGSTSFSRSMGCYTSEAAAARAELVRLEASAHSPERKARLAAVELKRAEAAEHLAAQSAFNAAQGYVRLGQRERALNYVDVAAAHAQLRDKAASLRALIEKMR